MSKRQIALFVDDERNPPSSEWIVARNAKEALTYIREDITITHMSLDWYMGSGMLDGIFISNEMVNIAEMLGLSCFSDTQRIWFHSSDRTMAVAQARIFEAAQQRGIVSPDCRFRINTGMCKPYRLRGLPPSPLAA